MYIHFMRLIHTYMHTYIPDQAVMSMMDEMDLIKKWKIPRKTIAR